MPVRAALLFVLDHEARLAGETEIFFERIDRLAPLRGRQRLVGARVDVGLIEVVFALGATGKRLHFAEGVGDGRGAETATISITSTRSFVSAILQDASPTIRRRCGCRR